MIQKLRRVFRWASIIKEIVTLRLLYYIGVPHTDTHAECSENQRAAHVAGHRGVCNGREQRGGLNSKEVGAVLKLSSCRVDACLISS